MYKEKTETVCKKCGKEIKWKPYNEREFSGVSCPYCGVKINTLEVSYEGKWEEFDRYYSPLIYNRYNKEIKDETIKDKIKEVLDFLFDGNIHQIAFWNEQSEELIISKNEDNSYYMSLNHKGWEFNVDIPYGYFVEHKSLWDEDIDEAT